MRLSWSEIKQWLSNIGGRLGSEFRYSIRIVYNTFPTPEKYQNSERLAGLAQNILDIRDKHENEPLVNLYNPDLMPYELHKAHHKLDLAVERLYRKQPFQSDHDRLNHLLKMYDELIHPLK